MAWQPLNVSAVVCRARSEDAAIAVLIAARLMSLRSPCDIAVSLSAACVKAEPLEKLLPASVRETAFVEKVLVQGRLLNMDMASASRDTDWTPDRANAVIYDLLQRGLTYSTGNA